MASLHRCEGPSRVAPAHTSVSESTESAVRMRRFDGLILPAMLSPHETINGGRMYNGVLACLGVALLPADVAQAASRLSIRAASVQPVDGWQQMRAERCQTGCVLLGRDNSGTHRERYRESRTGSQRRRLSFNQGCLH